MCSRHAAEQSFIKDRHGAETQALFAATQESVDQAHIDGVAMGDGQDKFVDGQVLGQAGHVLLPAQHRDASDGAAV
jgi:hypothetical protein